MESKKRLHGDDEEPVSVKKRHISAVNGDVHMNGVEFDQDEPSDQDALERFRKEAIFRRMKYYSRENQRRQEQIRELEKRKSTCEAGLAAISACWTQLVDMIRLLTGPQEDLPEIKQPQAEAFSLDRFLSEHSESNSLDIANRYKDVTHSLVTKFIQLGQARNTPLLGHEYFNVQRAQTECALMKSELSIARSELKAEKEEKEQLFHQLAEAQNSVARLQSKTVRATLAKVVVKEEAKDLETGGAGQSAEESKVVRDSTPVGTDTSSSVKAWKDMSDQRKQDMKKLRRDLAHERLRLQNLEGRVYNPPSEVVKKAPAYVALEVRASHLQYDLQQARERSRQLSDELAAICNKAGEECECDHIPTIDVLKDHVARRDSDISRLREARDQLTAEVNERKSRDSVKIASQNELKTLATSQLERIKILETQSKRLQAQLAAHAGHSELMRFILIRDDGDTYLQDLESRLQASRNRITALEQALMLQEQTGEQARTDLDTLERLASVTYELEKYRTLYGEPSPLADKVQEQARELERLRLLQSQHEESQAALFSEIDKVSSLWDALEKQVSSKVFETQGWEDKLLRAQQERSKAENKYYAAMKDKEAVEQEKKAMSKSLERLTKANQALNEAKDNLISQINALRNQLREHEGLEAGHREELLKLEGGIAHERQRCDSLKTSVDKIMEASKVREQEVIDELSELHRLQEEVGAKTEELERERISLKASVRAAPDGKHKSDEEYARILDLVKCSTCKQNVREKVISKCGHSFCKNCIDARISTRQRKCPSCNLPFATSDVCSLYLQ